MGPGPRGRRPRPRTGGFRSRTGGALLHWRIPCLTGEGAGMRRRRVVVAVLSGGRPPLRRTPWVRGRNAEALPRNCCSPCLSIRCRRVPTGATSCRRVQCDRDVGITGELSRDGAAVPNLPSELDGGLERFDGHARLAQPGEAGVAQFMARAPGQPARRRAPTMTSSSPDAESGPPRVGPLTRRTPGRWSRRPGARSRDTRRRS